MKYVDYLRNAAAHAVQFGGDCANLAGDMIANLPDQAAAVSSAVATYTETAGAAISAFVERESVETFNGVVSASSALASTLGDALENSPSYLESFAGMAADYTTAAAAAASAYLAGKESENSIQWVQIQDDGVYVQGYGGTSGGAGSSGEWDKITPPPKYPEAEKIPIVPPEIVPQGEPKIKKIKPKEPELTGCVNKLLPRLGFTWIEGSVLRYLDNIRCLRITCKDNVQTHIEWYAGTPTSLPSSCIMDTAEMLTGFRKGRYRVRQTHNQYIRPIDYVFYSRSEGWDWQRDVYWESGIEHQRFTHADAWRECITLDFGGAYFPEESYYCNITWTTTPTPGGIYEVTNGEGHAYSFTACDIRLSFLGDNFPPVEETVIVEPLPPAHIETLAHSAFLATLGAFNTMSFNNIFSLLRREKYGETKNIFGR